MKRCGKPAAWVVEMAPGRALIFCSRHLPKKYTKSLGLDFRKALPGEECGQFAFMEEASTAYKKTLKKSKDEDKAMKACLDIALRDKKPPAKKKPMMSNG